MLSVSLFSATHSCSYPLSMPYPTRSGLCPSQKHICSRLLIFTLIIRDCPRVSSFLSLLALSQKGAIIASLEARLGGIQPFFQGVLLCKNLWCLPQNHSPRGQYTFYGSRRARQSRYKTARYTSMASKKEKCRDSQCTEPIPTSQILEYLLQISAKMFASSRRSLSRGTKRKVLCTHSMVPFSFYTIEIILLILLEIVSDPVTELASELGSVEEKVLLLPFQSKTRSDPKYVFPFQSLS